MPIKILERMYSSLPRGLSQVEETNRLGLRGGESGGRLPHRLAMAVALHLPKPWSPGPYPWQGTGLGAPGWPRGGISCPLRPPVPWGQVMLICPREGGMGKLSQLRGRKPYRVLVHPHGHQGDAGQLPPRQPAIGANPASLPEPAVRAGGTRVGGWSCPGHASRGSSLGGR